MNDINLLMKNLINFNKDIQIKERIKLCNNNPSSHLCRNVNFNNYDEWYYYFDINNNKNLFSKGLERFETWKRLLKEPPQLYFSKIIMPQIPSEELILTTLINKLIHLKENKPNVYFFILASLIIIFQVFGDGNHRTAQHFMKIMGFSEITLTQMTSINRLISLNEYYSINMSPITKMTVLIDQLINISTLRGGRKVKSRKNIDKKTKRCTKLNKNIILK